MRSRLLSKICIDKLHVINDIKASRVLTLNKQLCANEWKSLQSNAWKSLPSIKKGRIAEYVL